MGALRADNANSLRILHRHPAQTQNRIARIPSRNALLLVRSSAGVWNYDSGGSWSQGACYRPGTLRLRRHQISQQNRPGCMRRNPESIPTSHRQEHRETIEYAKKLRVAATLKTYLEIGL